MSSADAIVKKLGGANAVGGLISDMKMISAYESAANWDVINMITNTWISF